MSKSKNVLCWQVLLNLFLCIHQKHRGGFQHSSFLPGGTTIAVGRFSAENGVIKVRSSTKENYYEDLVPNDSLNPASAIMGPNLPQVVLPQNTTKGSKGENAPAQQAKPTYQRTLSGGLQSEDEIQERVQFLSAWQKVVLEMEHWGWSKNWVLQGLPFRDGGSITKGIHSICLKEISYLSPTNKATTPTSPHNAKACLMHPCPSHIRKTNRFWATG
ncbi:hypothetical protein U9M48_001325 [Paspalum notatum var. saurae]|uniref:Uncharacterized protein n=1 Tax=Paspalum notatum var. saurae TaxID=547442 RepID=A0AAQ3SF37_PASNO